VPHITSIFLLALRKTLPAPSRTGDAASRAVSVAASGYRRLRAASPFTRSVMNW
jgi:hypothetical protein